MKVSKMQELTQEYLKSILDYNPENGIFTWKFNRSKLAKIGCIAGTIDKRGYIVIGVNQKNYKAHRLAWLYVYGEFPPKQIDHINHDRTDNRIANLRIVSNQENQKNKTKQINNTSRVTGVGWHKASNKWCARISVNKKYIHLGLFTDINEAIAARKQAELYYGFHANHGVAA